MNTDPWRLDDDPAASEPVASLLRAATPSDLPGPLPGEARALAAFRATGHERRRHTTMRTGRTTVRVAAAAAATGVAIACGGAAAAATGSLPGAAQQTAHDMLAGIGVTVPGPNAHANGHADVRGKSEPDSATVVPGDDPAGTPSQRPSQAANGKGAEVSNLAKTTTATGVDKGAQISTLASGGKSKAGEQHGAPSALPSPATSHKPPTPGSQGTAHEPSASGSQGTAHKPSPPGSPQTGDTPSPPGSDAGSQAGSGRP
jgi:hypothetical protein